VLGDVAEVGVEQRAGVIAPDLHGGRVGGALEGEPHLLDHARQLVAEDLERARVGAPGLARPAEGRTRPT
jgi:hypothetical protein